MRHRIDVDQVNYHKNSLANNTPYETPPEEGGYAHYPKKVEGHVIRTRSESFNDFFSQPRIFWNSLTAVEKEHTIEGFSYQLGKVKSKFVREQNVNLLVNVDQQLASIVADNIGVKRPSGTHVPVSTKYPSLSQANTPRYAYTQNAGVLIGNNFNGEEVLKVLNSLDREGVFVDVISDQLGTVKGHDGAEVEVNMTFMTTSPHLHDSLYVVGGEANNQAKFDAEVTEFVHEAYKHYKPIGIATTGKKYLQASEGNNLAGVIFTQNNPNFEQEFITAIGKHRFWSRV